MLGVSILSLSSILIFDFGTVPTVDYFYEYIFQTSIQELNYAHLFYFMK
jgi:hypothetical protein